MIYIYGMDDQCDEEPRAQDEGELAERVQSLRFPYQLTASDYCSRDLRDL